MNIITNVHLNLTDQFSRQLLLLLLLLLA